MPRQVRQVKDLTLYTYQELIDRTGRVDSGSRFQKALDRARRFMEPEGCWHQTVLEEAKVALSELGFIDADIQYSGFWSQGDGASFTCESVDLSKVARILCGLEKPDHEGWDLWSIIRTNPDTSLRHVIKICDWGYVTAKVVRDSHHYSHARTCSVTMESSERQVHGRISGLINEFEKGLEYIRLSACKAIYKSLSDEYEYQTSDESLADTAAANGWLFDIDGNHYSEEELEDGE
jgi:hypothetical protein